ncbi:MAG: c-type cytochrome domain-containing protein [Verrucomicrobiaceae bacterium]
MLRIPLLALLLSASLLHAQEDKALAEAVAKVNATGASLAPISAGAMTYRFTALNVAKEFGDSGLAPLAPLADKISSLDLARTKVTDAGLAGLAGMKNLTELHLENTGIGDAGLDHVKGLTGLEYLNLYGTKVTDTGLAKLSGLTKLKSLYLWQSTVTKNGVAALKKSLAATHINIGWTTEDDAKPVAVVAAAPVAAVAQPAAVGPAAPAAKLDLAAAGKAIVFKDVVLPILEAKCVSCHGAEKAKGKLRMHTFADAMKGGGDGPTTIVAGKPDDSLALVRIALPNDDDEHMPPSDEPQLTKAEIALLKWWIAEGASETLTVAAAKKTPDIEALLGGALKAVASKPVADKGKAEEKPKPKPLSEDEKKAVAAVAKKLQAINASLMPLAQDNDQQRLSVINAADKFSDKELAEIAPIAAHVVWVDLARSQITDAGISTLAKLPNLERLHLENTKIGDAGIAQLAGLQKLEYLNLYGTKVTDAGLAKLAGNKALKKVFVWQTAATQAGAKALEAKMPGLVVNVGLSEAEIAKLTAPPPAPPPAPAPAKKEEPKKPAEVKKDAPKPAAPAKAEASKPTAPPAPAKAPAPKAAAPPAPAKKEGAK